ncbi:MAG TPA: 30S ribosomal protein S17 [Candidatus Paceibacterota bacterium]
MAVITKTDKKVIHRTLKGVVVSDKMDKTRVVAITRLRKHPKYLRYYKITKRFKVHDAKNETKKGEEVTIRETRPLSKEKRWEIVKD